MSITVKIENDQGQFSVGVDTADQDTGEAGMPHSGGMKPRMMQGGMPMENQKDSGMQPVADIDAALSAARDLLTNPQAQAAEQGLTKDQIWRRAQADRHMANQPGGPMMGMK